MTLPTNGSWLVTILAPASAACAACCLGPDRSFVGDELDVGVGVDLPRGQLGAAVGAVLVDALDGDLAAADRLGVDVRAADEDRPPRLADALVRTDADRHAELAALGLALGDAPEDRVGRDEAVGVVGIG